MRMNKDEHLSFASRYIKENDLEWEPTSVAASCNGYTLRVGLVPFNDSATEAAHMENDYRNEANDLFEKNKKKKAENVIKNGHAAVESYLSEQRFGRRKYTEISGYHHDDPMAELEKIADSIRMGEISPIPPKIPRVRSFRFMNGKTRNIHTLDTTRSAYL